MIESVIGTVEILLAEIKRLERDNRQLNDNLTSVQTRCTELLNEVRELRARVQA